MKKAKLLILTLLAVLGYNTAMADEVSPYEWDFNKTITTSVRDFAVASNWKHIVGKYTNSWGDAYYMTYSYKDDEGIDASGTLLAYRQYAQDPTSYNSGATVYDLLVTPVISGEVKLYVKAAITATNSIPSFVEFYKVNETGTTRGDLIQRFTADDYVADPDIEGWSYVTINLDEAQRVGIRAQHVYLDNFSAASADIVAEKSLSITGLSSVEGGNYIVNQNEDGTTDIELKVTLKNTGDVDFNAGDANYTLTLVKKPSYGSETVFDDATFAIDQTIAAGEEATFIASFTAPAELGTGWMYLKVKENISGTTSSAQVWTQVKEYASGFVFDVAGTTYYSNPSPTTTPIDFGKVTEATTLNYEIYNPGSAPLTINSLNIDSPFTTDAPTDEFTVAAGEKKQVAITFPATEPGIFNGNITIEYTNFGKEKATYTLPVSATVLDPSKNLITFDNGKTGEEANGKFPEGSIHADQVYISKQTVDDEVNFYLQSATPTTKFITPLLTAEEGELFSFDTWAASYDSENIVIAYISKDRENWTQVVKKSGIGSKLSTITATIEEAGDYWLAFELYKGAYLDNIYGLTLAEQPEHNWYIISKDIPTKGKENNEYTATITLKNINPTSDRVEAVVFLDGEDVHYEGLVTLPANNMTAAEGTGRSGDGFSNIKDPTVITITFKPHKNGVLPLYIELNSEDETLVYTTETMEVNIAEEKTESILAIGEDKGYTNTSVPFYSSWMDDPNGISQCDILYDASVLKYFGLKENDVITAITFTGTPTGTKTINSLTAEAWVGVFSADSVFTAGAAYKPDMEHVVLYDENTVDFVSGVPVDFVINLGSPIVWDGTSSIRITTNINGHGKYQNIAFPVDNAYTCAYYQHGTYDWSNPTSMPVAKLSLDVEEVVFAGVVTDIAGNAIEGATVVAYNFSNDVEYTAVTDAEGKFSMNIVQNKLEYAIWVEKKGYQVYIQELRNFEDGSYTDAEYVLTQDPDYIEYTFHSTYGWGTFYSSTTNYAIPEGVNAFIVSGVENGMASLTEIDFGFIPAETAVVITGEPGETYGLEPYSTYEIPYVGENLLLGTDEDEEVAPEEGEKLYILSFKNDIVGFYYGGDDGGAFTNKAHRAYLKLKVANEVNSPSFIRIAGGSATGISNTITTTDTDAPAYNLAGQRVDKSYKGVVIVNGKKMLRK